MLWFLLGGWLAGLWVGEQGWLTPAARLAGAVASALLTILLRRRPSTQRWSLLALALCLGALRMFPLQSSPDAHSLGHFNDAGEFEIRGIVTEPPRLSGTVQRLYVRAEHIAGPGLDQDVHGSMEVTLPAAPVYQYGDELLLSGRLTTPARLGTFDYRAYLAHRGIYSLMRYPRVQLLRSHQGHPVATALYSLKDRLRGIIEDIWPAPYAGLLSAMLLGDERGISGRLEDALRASGTSHIVVISGWNITLLAGLVTALLAPAVGRRRAMAAALIAVAGYTALVGFDPPVVRAAIMGGLSLFALLTGRRSTALHSLALAALLMTAIQPHALWHLGFQLSFAATLGLITLYPLLWRGWQRLREKLGRAGRRSPFRALEEIVLVTLAAQFWTLPILLYQTGQLSLATLPANVLVLPAQPPLLGFGALATLAGTIWIPLGQALGWLAWPFAAYTVWVVEETAGLPWAQIAIPAFTPALLVVYYALLIALTRFGSLQKEQRRELWQYHRRFLPSYTGISVLGLGAVLLWTAAFSLPDGYLHVYFLDVGQGHASLIVTPAGHQILIDGGPDGALILSHLGRRMPLWDRTLDAVIATHPDTDHIAGLFAVLEHYQVAAAMDAGFAEDAAVTQRWKERVERAGAERVPAVAGAQLLLPEEGILIQILHPPASCPDALTDNDCSAVVRLSYGRLHILFMGDVERLGEELLLAGGADLRAAVLQVAHHGAAAGTTERLLTVASPAVAVISAGAGNPFGHPAQAVLRRLASHGAAVWRTDQQGTIEVISDGARVWIRDQRRAGNAVR
ncbi:MAG: DNA internalization-related competence protein ComEC/Rec2 [Anaerolineae bacterium]